MEKLTIRLLGYASLDIAFGGGAPKHWNINNQVVVPRGFTLVPHDHDRKTINIGERCRIRMGATIYWGTVIGDDVHTGHNVFIRENCIIREGARIGTNSILESGVVVGAGTRIQSAVYLPNGTRIGDDVFIGPCTVFTNDRYMDYGQHDIRPPVVENKVRIGANCTILPGVRLGQGSWIGAGSVVTKDTEPGWIYIGNPARKLKRVAEVIKCQKRRSSR